MPCSSQWYEPLAQHTHVPPDIAPQSVQSLAAAPHAPSCEPARHNPPESMHPGQVQALLRQLKPAPHTLQFVPAAPHARPASPGRQALPFQQPSAQVHCPPLQVRPPLQKSFVPHLQVPSLAQVSVSDGSHTVHAPPSTPQLSMEAGMHA